MQNKKQVQQTKATTCPFELCSKEHKHELALMLAFCTFHSDNITDNKVVNETQTLINIFIEQYFACIKNNG